MMVPLEVRGSGRYCRIKVSENLQTDDGPTYAWEGQLSYRRVVVVWIKHVKNMWKMCLKHAFFKMWKHVFWKCKTNVNKRRFFKQFWRLVPFHVCFDSFQCSWLLLERFLFLEETLWKGVTRGFLVVKEDTWCFSSFCGPKRSEKQMNETKTITWLRAIWSEKRLQGKRVQKVCQNCRELLS